jgi:hypothetical protein
MADITTGSEINSYRGDAALGTGEAAGYAPIDTSPIQQYALTKYRTNVLDFEQQQKDKAELQQKFSDPNLYGFLDQELAAQLSPDLTELKELSKKNLQMQPQSKDWYRFHELYNKVLDKNARAKTVQTLKDKYKNAAGLAADPHEKERMLAYVDKLSKQNIDDDIPAYDAYFKYNDAHVPKGLISETTSQRTRPDGTIENVKTKTYNPIGLVDETSRMLSTTPEAAKTYEDLSHTLLQDQSLLKELNPKIEETYKKGWDINVNKLQPVYATDYEAYKKANPKKTFAEFLSEKHPEELKKIARGMDYLKNPLTIIPYDGKEYAGFTYFTGPDGKKSRMSEDDKTIGAIYGATYHLPGDEEKVNTELGITPKDKFEAEVKIGMNNANNAQDERESIRSAKTAKYTADLSAYTAANKPGAAPELPFSPFPSMLAGIGGYNKKVLISSLPLSQVAAINPNWIEKGQIKPDFLNVEISAGKTGGFDPKNPDAGNGIFTYNVPAYDSRGKIIKGKTIRKTVNESQLKSNAESWIATDAKERKGQEVYGYIPELYGEAQNTNFAAPPAKTAATGSKTTTLSNIKALVGKTGYEGYTEKELIEYYKSQGYEVK